MGVQSHRRPIALSWKGRDSERSLRDTGIDLVRRVPWGSHLCVFCATKEDLIDSGLTYFRPAPAYNEYCLWIASEPLQKTDALRAVHAVPELERWRRKGAFEILEYPPGYSGHGQLVLKRVIDAFHARTTKALAKGFDGVRVCTNPPWRKFQLWADINAYERTLDRALSGRAMIMLCTYSMEGSLPADVLDVAHTHQSVMARRTGNWEFLKTYNAAQAKKEIAILNHDLERLQARFETDGILTERERVVLGQIVKGASSKAAARTLGISPRTVEYHRANAMQKLGAKNTAELVRMVLSGR